MPVWGIILLVIGGVIVGAGVVLALVIAGVTGLWEQIKRIDG